MINIPKNEDDWWRLVDTYWEELSHNINNLLELNAYQNFFNRKTRSGNQINKLEIYKKERNPKIKYFFKDLEIKINHKNEISSKKMVKLIEILNKYSYLV